MPSRAAVSFIGTEGAQVRRLARHFFGRVLHAWEYAGLCGAPDDARVEVGTYRDALHLELRGPECGSYSGVRLVQQTPRGPTLWDDSLHIQARGLRGKHLGLQMLQRQLAQAVTLPIGHIWTVAGRRPGENGYYTWPRYGFDGPLPPEILARLPHPLQAARRVLDLMETAEGRHWWRTQGVTLRVCFDLACGSRSWQVFHRYYGAQRADRGGRVDVSGMGDFGGTS